MIIVGELINSSRRQIAEAIETRDRKLIQELAASQMQNGAHFIDVNAGTFGDTEGEHLEWLVKTVQEKVEAPCCLDSPDPNALERALTAHRGTAMINSISLEKERYENVLPWIAGTDMKVIALCMSDQGMPETTDDRVAVADQLINRLIQNNIPLNHIYVDPLVQPVSTNGGYGVAFLSAIEKIMATFEGVHTMCGLSNISYGLPKRKRMNRAFMAMAISKGMDGAIVNPLDNEMMAVIATAEALCGKDEYCMAYLQAYREEKL